MIIRSGLIQNRDGVDFDWNDVNGPLALRVSGMRACTQNHMVRHLDAEGDRTLHRIDSISQLWFDDVASMTVAMESTDQRACIEDIRGFLSDVTILVQQEGEAIAYAGVDGGLAKLMCLLRGEADCIASSAAAIGEWLTVNSKRPSDDRRRAGNLASEQHRRHAPDRQRRRQVRSGHRDRRRANCL